MDSANGACLSRLSTEETIQSLGVRSLRRKVSGGLAFRELSALVTGNISRYRYRCGLCSTFTLTRRSSHRNNLKTEKSSNRSDMLSQTPPSIQAINRISVFCATPALPAATSPSPITHPEMFLTSRADGEVPVHKTVG